MVELSVRNFFGEEFIALMKNKSKQQNNTSINKRKHLTFDERLEIQNMLKCGCPLKHIGRKLGKDPTTISKEIKRNIVVEPTSTVRKDKDGNDLSRELCPCLKKSPFVCNPCKRLVCNCGFDKHRYYAKNAQKNYEQTLVNSRSGTPLSTEKFYENDRIITDCIKRGQKLYHVIQTHDLAVSQSTVYRHLHKGYLSISPTELPRFVNFKTRPEKPVEYVPQGLKIGRSFADFSAFVDKHGLLHWVEMDSLIGRRGGKIIVTLHFTAQNFMVGLLVDDKQKTSTARKILELKVKLQQNGFVFGEIFPLLLTDNGGEFGDVFTIELDLHGEKETSLFFCDPYKSSQKPHVEKNHTIFRDIVPSGTSFDEFTQDDVNLIFSHVNAVKRKLFNGKSPYDLFSFTYSERLASLLGISFIEPEQVIQSPILLNNILNKNQ